MLSLRWWRGTRALSRRELTCHRLLKSSAPLLWSRSLKRKNNTMKFALIVRLFGSTPDGCRGWQILQAGYCEVLIRLFEAFQWRIPASAKKRVRRWREEIWDVVAGSGLYSQTPLSFWRAMAGCIAIGSLATITAWLKKASVKRKKGIFPYLRRYLVLHRDIERETTSSIW